MLHILHSASRPQVGDACSFNRSLIRSFVTMKFCTKTWRGRESDYTNRLSPGLLPPGKHSFKLWAPFVLAPQRVFSSSCPLYLVRALPFGFGGERWLNWFSSAVLSFSHLPVATFSPIVDPYLTQQSRGKHWLMFGHLRWCDGIRLFRFVGEHCSCSLLPLHVASFTRCYPFRLYSGQQTKASLSR